MALLDSRPSKVVSLIDEASFPYSQNRGQVLQHKLAIELPRVEAGARKDSTKGPRSIYIQELFKPLLSVFRKCKPILKK
jgi:hypothetical protein